MKTRFNLLKAVPQAYGPFIELDKLLADTHLEPIQREMIKIRTSQINGCAYCLDMHSKDLRAAGETEQRLLVLDAWREAPFYTDRERAALAWAEAVTKITAGNVPNEIYEQALNQFSEQELIDLTLAVTTINTYNRINIAFGVKAGGYEVGQHAVH